MGHRLSNCCQKMTGSGQVTELWRHWRLQPPTGFSRKSCIQPQPAAINRNGDINHDIGLNMTTCDLWHCILTSRRPSEVTDLGWPHTHLPIVVIFLISGYRITANLSVLWVSWGFETEYVAIFYMDMVIGSLYTIRWNQGYLFTQFALRQFCRWVWRCTLLGCYALQTFHQETVTTPCFVQNWTGNTLVKAYCRYILIFVKKMLISRKFDLWPLKTRPNFDLGSKTRPKSLVLAKSNPLVFLLSSMTLSFETRGEVA